MVPCIWYLELNKLDILAKEQSQDVTDTQITNIDIPGVCVSCFLIRYYLYGITYTVLLMQYHLYGITYAVSLIWYYLCGITYTV